MIYVLGTDVSHWQASVDWYALWDQGYRFVFIKVSEGYTYEDIRWKKHYDEARAAGFIVGAYHYFTPSVNGIAQAGWFYSVIKDVEWDLPPALDVEEPPGGLSTASYAARVRACIGEMKDLWQEKPFIYTSANCWKYTGNMTIDVHWWVAHWTARPDPFLPAGCPSWKVWQYWSDSLDRNRFNGTYDDLLEFVGSTPPPSGELELRVKLLEAMVTKIVAWIGSWV